MTPYEIIHDEKGKSIDRTMHSMLAVNFEILPLSVPTFDHDISHA